MKRLVTSPAVSIFRDRERILVRGEEAELKKAELGSLPSELLSISMTMPQPKRRHETEDTNGRTSNIAQRMVLAFSFALALAAAQSKEARSWGMHYLVTDRTLEHASMTFLSKSVEVQSMEAFLEQSKSDLAKLFDEYYGWLESRQSKRFVKVSFDPSQPTVKNFLRAARLHPETRFPLINRLLPGTPPPVIAADPNSISTLEKVSPAFNYQFETLSPASRVSARSVLVTFSDEPDWTFDNHLWGFSEYGYGKIPYGKETGTSSRAAFHMLFAHENFIVKTFAPEILEGMTLDRVELFYRLAKLAFAKKQDYWGWRFAAWGLHYLQDLGQPYHSKAVPSADWMYYLKFIFSSDKAGIKKATTQLVQNRHFIYEDFVAYGLQQSYIEQKEVYKQLAGYLSRGNAYEAGYDLEMANRAESLIADVGKFASGHAIQIDSAIVRAFGPKVANDPNYDLESDPGYNVKKTVEALSPEAAQIILDETGKDFESTGRIARTWIQSVRGE
ncbi:MAG: hypothetical protein AAB425_07815 [Bdellovibrionota bacterium]